MRFSGHNLNLDDSQKTSFVFSNERLLQKPIFTNFHCSRETGDIKLTEYGVVLITFQQYIGGLLKFHFLIFFSYFPCIAQ